MSNKPEKFKLWDKDEEEQLINEINTLTDIDKIIKNHDRKITGITMRIEKIINDPEKSKKIYDQNQVILKYLESNKPKYNVDYNELYTNILKYHSIEDISNNYNKVPLPKIKIILNNFLKKNDIDTTKKLRIKCLLKSKDDLDFAEDLYSNQVPNNKNIKTDDKDFKSDNKDSQTDNNIISVMLSLIGEIKSIKTDIFDIKSRVKIIMDKVSKIEKNLVPSDRKNKSVNNTLESNKSVKLVNPDNFDNFDNLDNLDNLNNFVNTDKLISSDKKKNYNNDTNPHDDIIEPNKVFDIIDNDNNTNHDNSCIKTNKFNKSNKTEKVDKNKKVNINKQVEKIIISSENNISNINKITLDSSNNDNDEHNNIFDDEEELEKEFQKYFK